MENEIYVRIEKDTLDIRVKTTKRDLKDSFARVEAILKGSEL